MKMHRMAWALGTGCLLLAGNAFAQKAVPQRDINVRLAEALKEGWAASRADGKKEAEALASAARRLDAMGAKPAEGEPDLAREWSEQAARRGAVGGGRRVYRGRILGPAYKRIQLSAGAPAESAQLFLAGQRANVTLVVPEPAEATMRVLAPDEAPACKVQSDAGRQACSWTPVFTQRYRIAVQTDNPGPVEAFLIVN